MKKCLDKFQSFPEIKPDFTFPFASEGDFSMHELLEYLLEKTGPAKVCVSSFSISEIAIRSFFKLLEKNTIIELKCLFDLSVKQHKLGLLYFVNNIATAIALSKNHAKLILIENENWNLVVVGTANFQTNDKNEVGIVSTEEKMFRFYSEIFNKWFNNALLFNGNEFN